MRGRWPVQRTSAVRPSCSLLLASDRADQHEYVRRKLLATGNRCLIENSWRDDFWGWGPNRDGKNMLGTLWMK
ncbi:NADAR domain-containing protein, partial [Escherichia coli]|uniref:NADAR domain-containing protein n=1 Tax=Escherichia coli TaxID=562 RepID=UPI0039857F13